MEKLRELMISENIKEENDESFITIKGAKHHNLKNILIEIKSSK